MQDDDAAVIIRKATKEDVSKIAELLNEYAIGQLLLPRSPEDILKYLPNFIVAEQGGVFAGCAAERNFGEGLHEIRSLAVDTEFTGKGIGSKLIKSAVSELREKDGARVFALTYRTNLFMRAGFYLVKKELFPQKIWSDCVICPKKDCCDEYAVMLEI